MIQGTTPTHTFTLPFDVSMIDKVRIIYSQKDQPVVTKNTEDCQLEGENVVVVLTQEDTFAFDHNEPVEIQIRMLTVGGDAIASHIKKVDCAKCLEKEVL